MRPVGSVAGAALIVVLLIVSVLLQAWFLPTKVSELVEVFPEVAQIAATSIVWEVITIASLQAGGVVVLRLIARRRAATSADPGRSDRGLDHTELRSLQLVFGLLVAFFTLVVSAFLTLVFLTYGSPFLLELLLIAGVALAAIIALGLFLGTRLILPEYVHN